MGAMLAGAGEMVIGGGMTLGGAVTLQGQIAVPGALMLSEGAMDLITGGIVAMSAGAGSGSGGQSGGRPRTKKLEPDPEAEGPHSTYKRDPRTGETTGHAEWQPNPRNPSGFDEAKRVDVRGAPHFNKVTGEDVATPHTHGKGIPGGVRSATPDEVP